MNAYSVSYTAPFFKTVAEHVLATVKGDVLKISDVAIVVPSPRMAASLKQAFAKACGGSALLPSITTLSFSEDDLDILRFEEELSAKTVSPLHRLMIFASLVKAKSPDLPYAQILDDAWHLGDVFTRFSAYDVTKENLQEVLPENLATGWQENLDFLKIACELYPNWLSEQDMVDATVATQTYMKDLVETRFKHASHIFAVGFNDTTPAGEKVLADIAEDARGTFIFPPFEQSLKATDVQNPFYSIQSLVDFLGVQNIQLLGENSTSPFVEASASNTAHISYVACESTQEEAETIAFIMREFLENATGTCALVVPDRMLASRVSGALKYWGVDVDDSAGVPLKSTSVGSFILSMLNMVNSRFSPVQVATFLYHPLIKNIKGKDVLDTYVLRGTTPRYGLDGLSEKLFASRVKEGDLEACGALLKILEEQTEGLRDAGEHHVSHFVESVLTSLRFWMKEEYVDGEDVEAFMKLLNTLMAEANVLPNLTLRSFQKIVEKLMDNVTVRSRYGTHPRLFIWGAMEARLQDVDRVIIAGLNEGVWPRKTKADPWLNRAMNAQLGLLDSDTFIGLSAYDMLHLSSKKEVYWTRTVRDNEGETIPSRFILSLQTTWPKDLWDNLLQRGSVWKQRARALRSVGETHAMAQPVVHVDESKRPNVWSPSLLSKYMSCPYQVFASRILHVEKTKPYEEDPNAADKGELIHLCLEAMVHKVDDLPEPYAGKWSDTSAVEAQLLSIGEHVFGKMEHQGRKAIWWQKFKRIAKGFAVEMANLPHRQVVSVEEKLEIQLSDKIRLKARLDRMDKDAEGKLYILDYKTGSIPSWVQVNSGEAPQMGVEAVLAEGMGYSLGGLEYWSVKGERNENVTRKIFAGDLEELEDTANKGLRRLANELTSENFAYEAIPAAVATEEPKGACRLCDYAGLCRYKEWHK